MTFKDSKWKIISLFSLTLIVGVVIGMLIPRPWFDKPFDGRPDFNKEDRFRRHPLKRLDLSNQQEKQFHELADKYRDSVRTIIDQNRMQTQQRVDDVMDGLSVEMRQILNDEQYEKWSDMYRRFRDKMKFQKPDPRHGPPHERRKDHYHKEHHGDKDWDDRRREEDDRRPKDGKRDKSRDNQRN